MDRAQLKHFLTSGPSIKLDVRALNMGGLPPLFQHAFLNNAILIKQAAVTVKVSDDEELPPIGTLVYVPYNRAKPEDGGESFFYTPKTLSNMVSYYLSDRSIKQQALLQDTDLLNALDSIPTFSPFLMKDVLERAHIDIPDGYFVVGEKEAAVVKQRMRARLRPLVAVAFSGDKSRASVTSIERLVHKLWELDDVAELMPLVEAFRLVPADAPQIFYCWLGLAFFESEYLRIQSKLKRMATWLANNSRPKETLPRELLDHYNHGVMRVRKLLQGHWKTSLSILRDYTTTYDGFVSAQTTAAPFIGFLRDSKSHFWALGGALGRLEQSVEVWDQTCARVGYARLNYDQANELFAMLSQINAGSAPAMSFLDNEPLRDAV